MSGFYKHAEPIWWRAVTVSGAPAGLGFLCPACGFGLCHSAPNQIQHCGRVDAAPAESTLPVHNLGEPMIYPEKAEDA